MVCLQTGLGQHLAVLGQNGIALGMAGAGSVALNGGVELLAGVAPGHAAAHQVAGAALTLHAHHKIGAGILVAVGHDALTHHQTGVLLQHRAGLAGGAGHTAQLHGVHLQAGALGQLDVGHRVNALFAGAAAGGDVLFQIQHLGVLLQKETVNTVVASLLLTLTVHAAAGLHGHIGALADVEVVVDQIVHTGVGHTGGDVHGLALCAGLDPDHDAGRTLFVLNGDIFGGLAASALAVLPDVESALSVDGVGGDQAQQFVGDLVHTIALSFSSGQRTACSLASSWGRISCRGPCWRTLPSAITTISSAMDRIRS